MITIPESPIFFCIISQALITIQIRIAFKRMEATIIELSHSDFKLIIVERTPGPDIRGKASYWFDLFLVSFR